MVWYYQGKEIPEADRWVIRRLIEEGKLPKPQPEYISSDEGSTYEGLAMKKQEILKKYGSKSD